MSLNRHTTIAVLLTFFLCHSTVDSFAQYGIDLNIKKPEEFDNRVLQSEKTDKKKFSLPRRFMQNTMTHYNYFFNANQKLNEVLDRAKAAFKDDYSSLLSFYNYSLDATAADSIQLDSISYKAQTGIVLHDLRSDWADNLYLLWGASYYFQKQFDSAYLMFHFINYAFADKEKDGYYLTIGSARDGNNAFAISTKEKNGLVRKLFSEPPSRNDAFIWQVRNFLAQDEFSKAAALIDILKMDPVFPARLQNDLEEVQAYSFYKQQQWDSCAAHLVNALSNATSKQEQARWEYLLGQLYEMTGHNEAAETYYTKSIGHTTDPVMDVYARLALVRINKEGGEDYIEKNVATLAKMARKDKYRDYRDIIYYMAAQMEIKRNNQEEALAWLLKSTKYAANNPSQRNKAFLQLADLSFRQRKYRQSFIFYDSIKMNDPALTDPKTITDRKALLTKFVWNEDVINRQDSLQRLAALPEQERKDYVKKLARRLRKQQGLKEEETMSTGNLSSQEPVSLFADNNAQKGEWYFYNSTSRQKGLNDFKARWGTRPNADNWRRSAALAALIRNPADNNNPSSRQLQRQQAGPEKKEVTFDGLYENLPLTEEKMKQSNDSVETALFNLGLLYIQQLNDCTAGTQTLQDLRSRFPADPHMDEVLFNLYYCAQKNQVVEKIDGYKKLLNDQFPSSNFTVIANTGKNPEAAGPQEEPTKTYEKIYDLFIEGSFEEAVEQKKIADNKYGHNYWTPQLLYIEAVYYIKQGIDTAAKVDLKNIISRFAGAPMAEKAATLLDVLNRRKEIETELRNLVINRPPPDTTTRQPEKEVAITPEKSEVVPPPPVPQDTTVKRPQEPPVARAADKPKTDTAVTKPIEPPPASAYTFDAAKPYYVVIVLNKVDPVFVNEARNAFYRYNRDTYYNKQMNAELVDIGNDNRLLLISPFKNSDDAVQYIERTRPLTSSEILPWLKGGKYYYTMITESNLQVLKANGNIESYRQFIEKNVPGVF